MPEQVAELFLRLAQLADASGATPGDGSGIDGVWTTTVPAQEREDDWQIALNCNTETAHTVAGMPEEGDSYDLYPGSATIWLGDMPAGTVNPYGGSLLVQSTLNRPDGGLEGELIDDVEARMDAIDDPTKGGGS